MRRAPLAFGFLLLTTNLTTAADTPTRKSGLWEITTHMSAPQTMTSTMQQCVDEKSDNMTELPGDIKKSCSKNEVTRTDGKYLVDSICKISGTTATTHADITGDFRNSYHSEIKTIYSPPLQSMKEAKIEINAKWLGPCTPGMKSGDVIMQDVPGMPKGMKFNPSDIQKQAQ